MDIIIKALVVGICASILTLLIKKTNPEISTVLALCACAFIGGLAVKVFSSVYEVLKLVEADTGISSAYTTPIIKCTGIGIAAKLGAEVCKDSGQAALGTSIEICGACCALYVALPLVKTLLRMIGELT